MQFHYRSRTQHRVFGFGTVAFGNRQLIATVDPLAAGIDTRKGANGNRYALTGSRVIGRGIAPRFKRNGQVS